MFLRTPEIELTKDESRLLAESLAEVNRHYPIPMMKPEHVALAGLGGAIFSVYRGKFKAVAERKAGPKRHDVNPETGVTSPVPPSAPWVDFGVPNTPPH